MRVYTLAIYNMHFNELIVKSFTNRERAIDAMNKIADKNNKNILFQRKIKNRIIQLFNDNLIKYQIIENVVKG